MSVVADSLSAIKYAKVKCIRDEYGVVTDFEVEGDFPKYGNNDDRVDSIAVEILDKFMDMIRSNYCYRGGDSDHFYPDHHFQRCIRQEDR